MAEAIAPTQDKQAIPPSIGGGMVETITPATFLNHLLLLHLGSCSISSASN